MAERAPAGAASEGKSSTTPESAATRTGQRRAAGRVPLARSGQPARRPSPSSTGSRLSRTCSRRPPSGWWRYGKKIVSRIGTFFADGGLRRRADRRGDHPTVDELRALLAVQLILAFAIALGVAVIGFQAGNNRGRHGDHGLVAAPARPGGRHTRLRWSERSTTAPRGPPVRLLGSRPTAGSIAMVAAGQVGVSWAEICTRRHRSVL